MVWYIVISVAYEKSLLFFGIKKWMYSYRGVGDCLFERRSPSRDGYMI